MKTNASCLAAALASLALAATSARATLVQTKVFSTTELAYSADVSTSDLLTGLTPTTTGWNTGNGSTTAQLNDGIYGRSFATAGNKVEGTWTTVGATATYDLGLGANNQGYNLTSIQTFAAWVNVGFGNQAYTVDVKLVGAASYTTLATVSYQPLTLNGIGATKVTLTDDAGVLATRVEFIRFTANSVNAGQNSGAFVFREIDVFGTPTANSTPPQISTLAPLNHASGVLVGANLVATFSENIARGTGNITIKNLKTSSLTVIPVSDSQVSISGAVLTINPTADLATSTNYAIRIDATAIKDLANNPFAGISNDTTWNFSTASTTTSPLRIMCLGDSITTGYTDNPTWSVPFKFGYRSGLYTRLTNAGYNFKLVGGSTEPWTGISGDPTLGGTYTPALDLRNFGQDGHRGYGGVSIGTVNSNVAGYIAADTPDVILLLIGINGISSGSPALLNTLVNTLVTAAPNAHLIVAQITPLASFNQDLYNYNLYIRNTLVPSQAASGHKVTTVNLYSLFLTNPGDYSSAIVPNVLANGINHPDNAHYDLMAQEWFNGIGTLGLGPVDHFAISTITPPQMVGTPITGITLTAQDSASNTATGFTGTVTFGGSAGCAGTSANFVAGRLSGVSVLPTMAGSNLTLTVDDGSGHMGSTTITTLQTQYAAWAGGGAFDADAGNDGVANGLAWLLGSASPAFNARGLLPKPTNESGKLVLTFNCLAAAKRGAALLKVQCSNNVGQADPWTSHEALVPGAAGSSDVGSMHFDATANGDLIHVVVKIPASAASLSGKLFGRLAATETTP